MGKTGMTSMGVVEKCTVTINISLSALVKNVCDTAGVELGGELGTMGVLNAMDRPEDLFDSIENDAIARFFARMICGKTAVIGRMPIPGSVYRQIQVVIPSTAALCLRVGRFKSRMFKL